MMRGEKGKGVESNLETSMRITICSSGRHLRAAPLLAAQPPEADSPKTSPAAAPSHMAGPVASRLRLRPRAGDQDQTRLRIRT